jgi:hypothetical protein
MKKKWLKAVVIISVIVVLIGGGLLYYFKDMIFNNTHDSELGEYYGLFGYAPDTSEESLYIDYSAHMASFSAEIEAGMSNNATPEQKVIAAYIIYRIGCLADATALMRAKYTVGSGSASGVVNVISGRIDVNGAMNMTASYYDLKYPFVKPSSVEDVYSNYSTYGVAEEYTQMPTNAVSGSNETLVKLGEPYLRSSLPFARKTLYTPDNKVIWEADKYSCVITPESATAEFEENIDDIIIKTIMEIKDEEAAAGITRIYGDDWGDSYGLEAKDLSIHVVNLSTIIPESVEITKETGADTAGNTVEYYRVKFELDTLTGRGTPDSATYYAEQLYQSQAPQEFTGYLQNYHLYYNSLKVEMTVFTNGYFRTWGTEEQWEMGGSVDLVSASASIISDNSSMEAYCYDYITIMQGFVNRYYGDNSIVNMPINALPFYDTNLLGITAQAYGSYR